ncbi:hypothetical protein SDC9_205235 [bioreactor metagenome]|uniref:Uncharacterized protein n=1 Tax=bioreactor metagenome TaxID=1076179 RepID=A0A645J1S6_9ZZZZ
MSSCPAAVDPENRFVADEFEVQKHPVVPQFLSGQFKCVPVVALHITVLPVIQVLVLTEPVERNVDPVPGGVVELRRFKTARIFGERAI